MHRTRTFAFTLRLGCAVAAIATTYACDARTPTTPAPALHPASLLRDDESDGTMLGSIDLAPASGSSTFATILENKWALVRVSGKWIVKPNPGCAEQPPNWPCSTLAPYSGFDPAYPDAFSGPVRVRTISPAGSTDVLELRGVGGQDEAIGLTRREFTRAVETSPALINPTVQQFGTTGPSVPSYIFEGSYTVTVTEIASPIRVTEGAAEADGSRTYSVEPLYSLQFINPLGSSDPPGALRWYFVPGDSVDPVAANSDPPWRIDECSNQMTCHWQPPGPGRVQVAAFVETRRARARNQDRAPCSADCNPPGKPPALTCSPATRGQEASCTVTGDNVAVTRWRFASGLDEIIHESSDKVWNGVVVVSGTVYAEILVNGTPAPEPLTASLSVSNRGWHWGPDQWSFSQGTAPDCFSTPPVNGGSAEWGWNVRKGSCDVGRLTPNPVHDSTGFKVAQVSGGPNDGLWYVTEVTYRMDDESNINQELTANARHPFSVTDMSQAGPCRHKLGYAGPPPVPINFFQFNAICKNRDLSAMFAGIWAHEGMGSGSGNGHEAQSRIAAARPENDVYEVVEPLYGPTEGDLRALVLADVGEIDNRIQRFGGDHRRVNGNWCGSAWLFDQTSGSFLFAHIVTSENRCI